MGHYETLYKFTLFTLLSLYLLEEYITDSIKITNTINITNDTLAAAVKLRAMQSNGKTQPS